jgi:hypothetical protein
MVLYGMQAKAQETAAEWQREQFRECSSSAEEETKIGRLCSHEEKRLLNHHNGRIILWKHNYLCLIYARQMSFFTFNGSNIYVPVYSKN